MTEVEKALVVFPDGLMFLLQADGKLLASWNRGDPKQDAANVAHYGKHRAYLAVSFEQYSKFEEFLRQEEK